MTDLQGQKRIAAARDEARRFQNVRHLETRLVLELEDDTTDSGIYVRQIEWRTVVVGVRIESPALAKLDVSGTWRVSLAVTDAYGCAAFAMCAQQLAQSKFYLFATPLVLRAGVAAEIKLNAWKKSTRVALVCEMDAAPETGA